MNFFKKKWCRPALMPADCHSIMAARKGCPRCRRSGLFYSDRYDRYPDPDR